MCQFLEHKGHECIFLEDYGRNIKDRILKDVKEIETRANTLNESCQAIQKELTLIKSVTLLNM